MADDTTRIIISLETRIRNLERTLRGLDAIKKRLESVGKVGLNTQTTDRAAIAAQKLVQQQQRLSIQAQELSNRQERARQTTERLAQSQTRAARAQSAAYRTQQRLARDLAAEERRQKSASESLQRQRSAALIQQFRDQERARQSVLTLDQVLGRVGGSLRNLGLGLTSLGASLTVSLTAPLTALGILATQNAVTLDSLQRGLMAITGSAEEAGRQLARLTEIAKLPGIGFQEAIQGSIRLQVVGFNAEFAERALIQFSNAVALTGGGREELARITVQLGQLAAKGKVLAQDLKPIIEAGPAVGRALLEAFGTVNSEDIQELGLSSQEFLERLVSQLGKLPRAAAGLRNTFDNFADSLFRVTAAIGTAIIPILTRAINIIEPIILRLTDGFKQLPAAVQGAIVVFGGLTAALGPALFILGQFATGIGGLISAFGRLSALGLLPTIANFRLLAQVMRGTAGLAAGQAATTAAAAAGWIGLAGAVGAAIVVLGAVAAIIASYSKEQEKATEIDLKAAIARERRLKSLKIEVAELEQLAAKSTLTSDEQERLRRAYEALEGPARTRIALVDTEREKLEQLIIAKREQIKLDGFAAKSTQFQLVQAVIDALKEQTKAQEELNKAKAAFRATALRESIQSLDQATREARLVQQQTEALKAGEKAVQGFTAAQQNVENTAAALIEFSQATGISTDELLAQALAVSKDQKAIDDTREAIKRIAAEMLRAVDATDQATDALERQIAAFIKLSDAADQAQKSRRAQISGVLDFIRENTESIEDARRALENYIQLFPEIGKAIEKEKRAGTIEDFLNELTGLKSKRGRSSDTAIRTAREQLAKALVELAEKEGERLAAVERASNDRLLDQNESNLRLRLIAYRQYLNERARLTNANLQLEINAQQRDAAKFGEEEKRAQERARQAKAGSAEQIKAQAAAIEAASKRKNAEIEVINLQARQRESINGITQALREAEDEQIREIRSLQIEFAELQGRIEDSLNAATVERFREELETLARAQDDIGKRLQIARQIRDADAIVELESAQRLNQSQIDAIGLITQQEFATNRLTAAQEFVRRAKERQAELEREIAFEVEFRGLTEEQAIAKRLEGERRLAGSLQVVRDLVQETVDALRAQGVEPPRALIEFIRDTKAALQGLGELSFSEQFRLAEKEFNRINDERLRRIADVERAIRERDIAEIEGMLIIRRINGEYADDLQQQVDLLKQIAAQSNDITLQRQAADLEQTAKDANSQLADFNTQLRSTSIDALRDGFTDFFSSLTDNTTTAKEKLLDLVNSVANRIQQVIAENLSEKLIESLFGDGSEDSGGIIDSAIAGFKRLLGIGGVEGKGGITDVAGKATESATAAVSLTTGATTAATALTTGGTAAAAALTTGGATASATLVTSLTAAAASFSAAVIAAGAAFAAAVAAASTSQAASGIGSALGGAATGLFPAVPGGAIHIVEGGYPEAVLTTDPKYAARQVGILRELIQRTRGFYGRIDIPEFAIGGIVSRETAEANLLSSINRAPAFSPRLSDAAMETAGGAGVMSVRIVNQVESRALARPYLTSEEGVRDVLNIISQNSNEVVRRLPRR